MTIVRGILMGLVMSLVMSLAAMAVPAHAAAPEASAQVHRQAAKDNWEIIKEWKNGVVRGCRSKWDGDSFYLQVQLVNRADRGRRGATLGFRGPTWSGSNNTDYAPIGAGKRQILIEGDAYEKPRSLDVRAKVTKEKKDSRWSRVLRLDRLNIC